MGSDTLCSNIIFVKLNFNFELSRDSNGHLVRTTTLEGLASALPSAVLKSGGSCISWAGIPLKDGESIPGQNSKQLETVDLDPSDAILCQDFYHNGILSTFNLMPSESNINLGAFEGYRRVNDSFAFKVVELIRRKRLENPDQVPIILIEDEHLMLAPATIRQLADEEGLPIRLVFSFNSSFPPPDVASNLSQNENILQGVLCCDHVGFQTLESCHNFVESCNSVLGVRVDRKNLRVEHVDRSVGVKLFVSGTNFDEWEKLSKEASGCNQDQKIILSMTRLERPNGLLNKLLAFENLLKNHPEHIQKVKLILIQNDVRNRSEESEKVDKEVSRLNQNFKKEDWIPVKCLTDITTQVQLSGLFRDADVFLCDEINQFAKEFVACRIQDNGVLVLSSLHSSSKLMPESVKINPFDVESIAIGLQRALAMPNDEREVRMKSLRSREQKQNAENSLKDTLKKVNELAPPFQSLTAADHFDNHLLSYFKNKSKVALLLDYDGTLSPIVSHPDLAILPPATRPVLESLASNADVFIAIVSGRGVADVKSKVNIEGITYAGSHGLEILSPDGSRYLHPMPDSADKKIRILKDDLLKEVCLHGAWVEDKGSLLTFHYREVEVDQREPLVERARELISEAGFKVGIAHCALEAKPKVHWDKGRASLHILRSVFGVSWPESVGVIFAGDDVTDEDGIVALKGLGMTFRIVGKYVTKTSADVRLPSTDSVLELLKWVDNHFKKRMPIEN